MSVIHYWPLDEEAGGAIADWVGGVDAATVNDPDNLTPAPALFGYGRDLSAAVDTAHIDLWPAAAEATSHAQWALVCWFKSATVSPTYAEIWNFGNFTTDTVQCEIRESGDSIDVQLLKFATDEYQFIRGSELTLFDGAWHLLVIQSNGSSVSLIVDTVVQATGSFALPDLIPRGAHAWFGGTEATSSAPIIADDLAIFSRALTTEEIGSLWDSGAGASVATVFSIAAPEPAPEPPDTSWADAITTEQTYYALEIDDGVLDPIRPPISSWQATVQAGRASYAQAVIPAAINWVSGIDDRESGELIIYRGARFPDGTTQETELARAPMNDVRLDQGPTNVTMTISGYSTIAAPEYALTRTLRNVRSESTANGLRRVRCDIDWFLRPGNTAIARGSSFVVSYINYYVNSSDAYMDVGERAI